MDNHSRVSRVLWRGSSEGGLGWLQSQIQRMTSLPSRSLRLECLPARTPMEELIARAETDADRLILACENRWDYVREEVEQLMAALPEVPVALAVSDWWLGWRRTGMGHPTLPTHVCLPWFRWWDGWLDWLLGSAPTMLGPFPSNLPLRRSLKSDSMQLDRVTPSEAKIAEGIGIENEAECVTRRVLVLGGCRRTVQMWQQSLELQENTHVSIWLNQGEPLTGDLSEVRLSRCWDCDSPDPDWLLWDDSRLPTVRGDNAALHFAIQELRWLKKRFPAACLWIAWTLPGWHDVRSIIGSGLPFELIAKPYFGSFSSAALERM